MKMKYGQQRRIRRREREIGKMTLVQEEFCTRTGGGGRSPGTRFQPGFLFYFFSIFIWTAKIKPFSSNDPNQMEARYLPRHYRFFLLPKLINVDLMNLLF